MRYAQRHARRHARRHDFERIIMVATGRRYRAEQNKTTVSVSNNKDKKRRKTNANRQRNERRKVFQLCISLNSGRTEVCYEYVPALTAISFLY